MTLHYHILFIAVAQAYFVNAFNVRSAMGNDFWVSTLMTASDDDLILLFTANTKLNWFCEEANTACKAASEQYRKEHNVDQKCNLVGDGGAAAECLQLEAEFSNSLQRYVMGNLSLELPSKPAALVINGDLTAFGHDWQLEKFKKMWLDFPVKVLPGLGDHDYELNAIPKNIRLCEDYACPDRMLKWFIEYTNTTGFKLHAKVLKGETKHDGAEDVLISPNDYFGSLAYTYKVCSISGANCGIVIQLNNRPNYRNRFETDENMWTIQQGINCLEHELRARQNSKFPIFINLHNLDDGASKIIKDAIRSKFNSNNQPQIFVLFGRSHGNHSLWYESIRYKVPFIYSGSVPNNRFTVIKIKNDQRKSTEIYRMAAERDETELFASIQYLDEPTFEAIENTA